MRIYLKGKAESKEKQRVEIAEKLGADYVEDGMIVFKMPNQVGEHRIAVALTPHNYVRVGIIAEECDNFISSESVGDIFGCEVKWLIDILTMLKEQKIVKLPEPKLFKGKKKG